MKPMEGVAKVVVAALEAKSEVIARRRMVMGRGWKWMSSKFCFELRCVVHSAGPSHAFIWVIEETSLPNGDLRS